MSAKEKRARDGLASDLRWLARHMRDVSASMAKNRDLDAEIGQHALELEGAANITESWAAGISEIPNERDFQ